MTGLAPAARNTQPPIWNPNNNTGQTPVQFTPIPQQYQPIPQQFQQPPAPIFNSPQQQPVPIFNTPPQQQPNQQMPVPQIPQPENNCVQSPAFGSPPTFGPPPTLGQQAQSAPIFNPQAPIQQAQQINSLDITQLNEQQITQAMMSIIQRLNSIGVEMKQMFFERDAVIDDLIRALVAQHHVLLLGPPGTAKTMLAKELTARITGARLFSWLLNKSSDPSEVLGPYSVKSMERDKFKRILDGKIADCEVCFIDELFKSNEPTLNILLSILNERIVYNDGQAQPVPLKMLIGSSNPTVVFLNFLFLRL